MREYGNERGRREEGERIEEGERKGAVKLSAVGSQQDLIP
ncbi:MAG: hypothetical protein DUW69_000067 [Verrucomicrobia bacterium]|jgi:hypothetical protein|nr:MAG: hypothetical protein DUW69_000067 [Verrucomicrobiota bacterium]